MDERKKEGTKKNEIMPNPSFGFVFCLCFIANTIHVHEHEYLLHQTDDWAEPDPYYNNY